jgi:hypothetical protein
VGDITDDTWMAQLGQELGFAQEALAILRLLPGILHQLHRHDAAAQPIAGPIHRPHAAGAGLL